MKVIYEPKAKEHDPELYQADRESVYYNGWDAIDSEAIGKYREEGYLIVRGGYSDEDVEAARAELEAMTFSDDPACDSVYYEGTIRELLRKNAADLDNTADGRSLDGLALGFTSTLLPDLPADLRSRYVRKFMGFTDRHESLKSIALHPRLLRLVGQLCRAGEVELFQEMAMIKPPGGREKPWHQDHAYFNHPLETPIIGAWIALGRVTPENGCMYLLPGAQNQGPILHFMRRDWQICDDEILQVLAHRRVAAPMEQGDVLIFDSKLPHGTPKNQSDSHRWALQLHYRPVMSAVCPDEERLDKFGSEGKDVTC